MGRITKNFWRTAHAHQFIAAEDIADGGGRDGCAWPQCVDCDTLALQFARQAEHTQAHAEFCYRIGNMVLEPLRLHVEWRRKHEDVRVGAAFEMRNAGF